MYKITQIVNESNAHLAEIKELLKMYLDAKQTVSMYTISEACDQMKISKTTFDRYKKEGKISVTKVGGKNYVSQAAIHVYMGK